MKKIQKLPKVVTIQLTELCNLRCKMCYEWGETGCFLNPISEKKPKSLDLGVIKQLLKDLSPSKRSFFFFGGEPLMYPYLEEVITIIKQTGSVLDTPTNGTLLDKHAKMLVKTGFDSVRVSIDGPREVNDSQRGRGSFDKAMDGIETLYQEKQKAGSSKPNISIIYTVTPNNYLSIEQFFLKDINLSTIDSITIQMQNFLTYEMGEKYAKLLKSEFNISSESFWKGFLRSLDDFSKIDTIELSRQIDVVRKRFAELNKGVLLLPPTFSSNNLLAYNQARWNEMEDLYDSCPIPWISVDITASGDVAPCHTFFDLVRGNLYEKSFLEIWNGEKYQKFRMYMKENRLMSICPGCCILYLFGNKKI